MTQTDSVSAAADHSAVLQMITGFWVSQVVASAGDLNLAEHLERGPKTAAEVATAEGASEDGVRRLLRACAGLGLVTYSGDGFAATSLLEMLHKDSPLSLKIPGARAEAERRGLSERLATEPGDFFEWIPTGGDLYLLKCILHDWDDDTLFAEAGLRRLNLVEVSAPYHLMEVEAA
jgi:hypothetical protein